MPCGHCASVVAKAAKQADPRAPVEIDQAGHCVPAETAEDRTTTEEALTEADCARGE